MEIFEILSPSGREENMISYIKAFGESQGYKCNTDVFGNLICEKGDGKIAVECGVDSVALMKIGETDSGMIKVSVPSSKEVSSLVGKKVKFLNGVVGVVRCDKTENIEDSDLNIDIGETDKEGTKEKVPMGEFATLCADITENEKFIFGNGISVYAPIITALEVMKNADDTAFLFTTQKKFAGRGLKALLGGYEADTVISINTIPEKDEVKCTEGAVVIIKEKGAVPTEKVRKALIKAGGEKVQVGATEDNLFLDLPLICGKGALTGGVCIGVRDKGKAYEGIAKADIKSAAELILNYINKVN
ncbi:MAG: hypothetical protein IJE44_00530 [Clostridia bacterium]|nr:hypothetical protein [Clostridia bacterium]